MALIKCSECGHEVSDKASACVHCGAPLTESKPQPTSTETFKFPWSSVLLAIGAVLLVMFVAGAFSTPKPELHCLEASHAAHYIAAESGNNPGGAMAVTDDVIASHKYPDISDKQLALLGSIVQGEIATMSPDQIAHQVLEACRHPSKH